MKFLKNFDWSAKSVLKAIGVIFLAIVALSIAITLISFAFKTVFPVGSNYMQSGKGGGIAYDMAMEESAYYDYDNGISISRGIAPTSAYYPEPGYSSGNDAEAYEVKQYSGTIRTRKMDKTCEIIDSLKAKDYIIFEDSNKNDDYCYYRFKVVKDKADEVVKIIEDMKPEVFNVNVQSIKKNVEGIEDELSILQKKLDSIEETLENSENAYDEISQLATNQKDAETLAKVIDSKLNLIERLTNQKLQVKEQIDRYNESRGNQLDRLNYTFFDINVYKDLIFDWKSIKDSWKYETKQLVYNVNKAFQAVSLYLITYLVRFAQFVLYLFISVFLLKFVWIGVKKIWKGEFRKKGKK